MSTDEHREKAAQQGAIQLAVVTVSDTRSEKDDANGAYLKEQIVKEGHLVNAYHVIKDEPSEVEAVLNNLLNSESQIILFNGGTGISSRDRTYDVLSKRLDKVLPGFGEIFRMLSYEQVGAAAMLSRAVAGVCQGKVIVSIPGSPKAVKLAWEKLIASELHHLAWEVLR